MLGSFGWGFSFQPVYMLNSDPSSIHGDIQQVETSQPFGILENQHAESASLESSALGLLAYSSS